MPKKHSPLHFALIVILSLSSQGWAPLPQGPADTPSATVPSGFTDTLVTGLNSPTALAFTPAPDPKLIATRQSGQVEVYELSGTLITTAVNIDPEVCSDWERGLLGIALDPNFAANRYAYLFANFGACNSSNDGRVVRYTVNGNWTFDTGSRITIIDNIPSIQGNHNGGDIHFGQDGKLYISVGDSGTGGSLAQDKSTLAGKILRINADGTPPTDNPFYSEGGAQRCGDSDGDTGSGTCREIYAYGLRNPFRFAMDPNATGTRFFINDVGQSTWEEIDENAAGANYGWPVREGPCPIGQSCSPSLPSAYTDPIHWLNRSAAGSITGGAFVPDGSGWPTAYDDAYLFGDYVQGTVYRINRTSTTGTNQYTRSTFISGLGSSSAVALMFGPTAGGGQALYYTNYQNGGEIRRVTYTAGAPPVAALSATPLAGPSPLSVNFDASASTGGAPLTFSWDFGDGASTAGAATIQHTYTSEGVFTATVTVLNTTGSSTAQRVIQVGTPPVVTLSDPAPGTTFTVGQTVSLAGSAIDGNSDPLPPSSLQWLVLLHHVDEGHPEDVHTHPLFNQGGLASADFTAPPPEDLGATALSYVEVRLTATDALGLTTTITREVQPQRVDLTFNSAPGNLIVYVSDTIGPRAVNNASVVGWTGWTITATAPLVQSMTGAGYAFQGWADGPTAPQRAILVGSSDAEYQALYGPADMLWLPLLGHP
ncbi:MAG: PQQ-dependent sugar dehydrogenase [Anaerolineales bacterium]|nr:PQQ-dependent sugar dehydrogenase [Anaerolineales bacterium]